MLDCHTSNDQMSSQYAPLFFPLGLCLYCKTKRLWHGNLVYVFQRDVNSSVHLGAKMRWNLGLCGLSCTGCVFTSTECKQSTKFSETKHCSFTVTAAPSALQCTLGCRGLEWGCGTTMTRTTSHDMRPLSAVWPPTRQKYQR